MAFLGKFWGCLVVRHFETICFLSTLYWDFRNQFFFSKPRTEQRPRKWYMFISVWVHTNAAFDKTLKAIAYIFNTFRWFFFHIKSQDVISSLLFHLKITWLTLHCIGTINTGCLYSRVARLWRQIGRTVRKRSVAL